MSEIKTVFERRLASLRRPETTLWDVLVRRGPKDQLIAVDFLIPEFELARAKVFLDEINERLDWKFSTLLKVTNLVGLLYYDFLLPVRAGYSVDFFYERLNARLPLLERAFFVSELVTTRPNVMERVDQPVKRYKGQIEIRSSYVSRGEVLLREITSKYPSFSLSVSELLSLLLVDFTHSLAETSPKTIQKRILQLLTPPQ